MFCVGAVLCVGRVGEVVVEAGDQVLPGGGVQLLRAQLPITQQLSQDLLRTHLEDLR